LSQFKKYHPSENLKFKNLDICKSLILRNLTGKNPLNSLKLNFTPNTLGCYGLNLSISVLSFKKISRNLKNISPLET